MKHKTYIISLLLLTAGVAFLGACKGGDSPTEPTEEKPSIEAVSGGEQIGIVATELAQALVVKVSKSNGEPVNGTTVTWSVTAGEGSLSSASTTTGGQGRNAGSVDTWNHSRRAECRSQNFRGRFRHHVCGRGRAG